jgi:hypothetical protein
VKTKQQLALELVARIKPGLEQDLATLEENWPVSRRGSRADRAYQSAKNRILCAVEFAEQALGDADAEHIQPLR